MSDVEIKLADGWSLVSGSRDDAYTAGDWVALYDPDGNEILYWDNEEWRTDPILVMGAIMRAASDPKFAQQLMRKNRSPKPSKRKFYRTVLQVEILSEAPFAFETLQDVAYQITDGPCSGDITEIAWNEVKTGPEMAELLQAQRSDPEFFQLTVNGEDTQEEDFHGEPVMRCDQCGKEFQGPTEFSGNHYDCWDEDGRPAYHYDCCSRACWEKFVGEIEHCNKCDRDLHPLQEHPAHPPRGSSMTENPENPGGDLICRRCAEANNKAQVSIFKPGETGELIVPPNFQAMITGVRCVFANHPRYRITYEDGTTEEAVLPDTVDRESLTDFLRLVGALQDARASKTATENAAVELED